MSLNHHRGGAGDALVLVHGLGSQWGVWSQVLPALEARHEVIAIDLPGFAGSPPDGTGPRLEDLAARVERFFEEAGLDHPHVAGNSLGGGIALELARRGTVRSATAIAPIGFWTARERAFCQASLRNALRAAGALRPALPAICATGPGRAMLLAQNFAKPWRMTRAEALETITGALDAPSLDEVMRAFDHYTFHDAEELRGVPVTVAWGDRDRLLLYRQAERAQRVLPWARHVTLAGCGHVPFWDDAEQVSAVMLEAAKPQPEPAGSPSAAPA